MPLGIYLRTKYHRNLMQLVGASGKGKIPWNKGTVGLQIGWRKGKKATPEEIEKNRISHLGQIPWNKEKKIGKNIVLSLRLKGKQPKQWIGKKFTLGKRWKWTEESKQKLREYVVNHPCKKFKDTSIELKIEEELKERDISYKKQFPLCKVARVDFYLPDSKIVIQCDGDYWHNLINVKEKGIKQDKILFENGYKVYRFWEHEINKSPKDCIDTILCLN